MDVPCNYAPFASGGLLGDGIDCKVSLSSLASSSEFVGVRSISDGIECRSLHRV